MISIQNPKIEKHKETPSETSKFDMQKLSDLNLRPLQL